MTCVDCKGAIDPRRDYAQVEGWARSRKSTVTMRRETGAWLCATCHDMRKLKGEQLAMF